MLPRPHNRVYPKLGIGAEIGGYIRPGLMDIFKPITYGYVYGYLPGLYKTHGTIWYKGKKQRFSDERVNTWNDGVTAYMVFRKKHTVEIHHANSDKKDKYSGKFKFDLEDFDYSMKTEDGDILLILKQHRKAKGTIKEVRALIDAQTLAPKYVKIKVALFWAKIRINNFKSGGISDDMFVFPADRYKEGYKWIDKREK